MKIRNIGWDTVSKHIKNGRPLTTFEVSQICGVVHSTVSNWIDQGNLTAFKTLGRHRRVRKDHLLLFMKLHQIPIPDEILPLFNSSDSNKGDASLLKKSPFRQKRIAIIGKDSPTLKIISETVKKWQSDLDLMTLSDAFEAGKMVVNSAPNLVIIDLSDSPKENYFIVEKIRQDENCSHTKILAIKSGPFFDLPETAQFDGIITKPIDLYKLTTQIKQLL